MNHITHFKPKILEIKNMTKSEKILIPLIKESTPHRIVNLMYYCERSNNYSNDNMIDFLTRNENLNKPLNHGRK